MKVRIEVTDDDIARGRRRCGTLCPIARAVKRTLTELVGRKMYVAILPSKGYFGLTPDPSWIGLGTFDLPRRAKSFIDRFDAVRPVRPFVFHIDV